MLVFNCLARVGAVAKLRDRDYFDAGDQFVLRFTEKGGKSREIPVRHDLQQFMASYLAVASMASVPPDAPLFRTAIRRTKRLTEHAMTAGDLGRMVKRRMRDAGLPACLSPHSFRVATITDLLTQGVPLEDVQHLAGHADPELHVFTTVGGDESTDRTLPLLGLPAPLVSLR